MKFTWTQANDVITSRCMDCSATFTGDEALVQYAQRTHAKAGCRRLLPGSLATIQTRPPTTPREPTT